MKFKDFIKKYWFLCILAIAAIVFVGMYASESIKNRQVYVQEKQVDGKYVAYTVNDKNGYADDLYNTLYDSYGISKSYLALSKAVIDASYETTAEMDTVAGYTAQNALMQLTEEQILEELYKNGYVNGVDDLKQYIIDGQKQQLMLSDYYKAHKDDVVANYVSENDPRKICHILIKVADVKEETDANGETIHTANPTEEEKAKLDEVLKALETKDFEEVAKEYSEDTSKDQGGYLGVVDKTNNTQFVTEFAKECLTLESGKTSEVITTQFGYHILYNKPATIDELLEESSFITLLNNTDPYIAVRVTKAQADKLGFTIEDQKLLKEIENILAEVQ